MSCLHRQLGQGLERLRTDYAAASTPAGNKPTTHTDDTRRGVSAEVFERLNAPQIRADKNCHLARRGMAWIVAAVTWITAGLLIAWLAGGGADKAIKNISHAFRVERLGH